MAYSDFQIGIYLNGTQGIKPAYPTGYAELEEAGQAAIDPNLLGYVAGAAGNEFTQDANVEAFRRWGLWPRMLVGATERDLSCELFGVKYNHAMYLAPVGVLGACYEHGDVETAKAAAATNTFMIASTLSADPMEDVAAALGDNPGFFQLYTPKDRGLAESFVHRAEKAGFKGIVVTLDTWINGWRPRDLDNAYMPMLEGKCLANYTSDPRFAELVGQDPAQDLVKTVLTYADVFGHSPTWDDLEWYRSMTDLPILLKGICHPDDARRALDMGVDGIICSNHGGRQANGGLPALECLPSVIEAADGAPVLFDSGVRGGEDIVKALAMGATSVGIGRPYVYGLALGGAAGVEHVVNSFLCDADLTMAVDGYRSVADLTPDALKKWA